MNSTQKAAHLHLVDTPVPDQAPLRHRAGELPDNSLVAAACQGDRHAFELLLKRHQLFIYRFCLSMLRHEHEAEDASQEVFIRAWNGLKKFRQEGRFQTWLGSIAVNHCRDRIRRRKKQQAISLDALQETTGDTSAFLFDHDAPDPETKILYYQLSERILSILPDKQRAALTLQEVSGFTYEEIATILNTSTPAVKSLIWRARNSLLTAFPNLLKD